MKIFGFTKVCSTYFIRYAIVFLKRVCNEIFQFFKSMQYLVFYKICNKNLLCRKYAMLLTLIYTKHNYYVAS